MPRTRPTSSRAGYSHSGPEHPAQAHYFLDLLRLLRTAHSLEQSDGESASNAHPTPHHRLPRRRPNDPRSLRSEVMETCAGSSRSLVSLWAVYPELPDQYRTRAEKAATDPGKAATSGDRVAQIGAEIARTARDGASALRDSAGVFRCVWECATQSPAGHHAGNRRTCGTAG
jgi:hypothetical protein